MKLTPEQLGNLTACGIVRRAHDFAELAHQGQFRSNKVTPYFSHPERVVSVLEQVGITDDEILAAAFLHDTIEDCDVSEDDIFTLFGDRVLRCVVQMTNKIEGDNHEREHGQVSFLDKHASLVKHCQEMDQDAKWIKLADRLDNLRDAKSNWRPKRTKRYAVAGYELVEAMIPWPAGSEKLVLQLLNVIYGIVPAHELFGYVLENDVRE